VGGTLSGGTVSGGTDYWGYVLRGGLTMVQAERGEVGTLTAVLEDYDAALDFASALWSEVYCYTNTGYFLFGGYLVSATPEHSKAEEREIWTLRCESWATLLNRALPVRKTWTAKTCGYIVDDLFTEASLTSFDTSTYVTAGDTLESFVSSGEKLADLMDKLALLAHAGGESFVWWITPQKAVRFGLASSFDAPFDIAPLASADWISTFPPLRSGSSVGREYIKDEYVAPPEPEEPEPPSSGGGTGGGRDSGGTVPSPSAPPIKWF